MPEITLSLNLENLLNKRIEDINRAQKAWEHDLRVIFDAKEVEMPERATYKVENRKLKWDEVGTGNNSTNIGEPIGKQFKDDPK